MERKCEFVEQNIIDFVYGEIDDQAIVHEMHEHIKGCAHCAALVKQYKEIAKAAATKVNFSQEVWDMHAKQVMDRLEHGKGAPLRKLAAAITAALSPARLGYALLMLAVVGTGIFYVRQGTDTTRGRELTEKVDLFQNLEIIERLDFYEAMSETKGLQGPGNSF